MPELPYIGGPFDGQRQQFDEEPGLGKLWVRVGQSHVHRYRVMAVEQHGKMELSPALVFDQSVRKADA